MRKNDFTNCAIRHMKSDNREKYINLIFGIEISIENEAIWFWTKLTNQKGFSISPFLEGGGERGISQNLF